LPVIRNRGRMFWAKRLKFDNDGASWALPFGDLMSLLLAVFVMIAAMSELRAGRRFETVGHSVKSAFGFQTPAGGNGHASTASQASMLERLAAGLGHSTTVRLAGPTEEPLGPCELIADGDRLVIRMAAAESFMGPTAIPSPHTRKLLAVIADYLQEGQARLEVHGYGPEGVLPPGLPYRDGLDVACERARMVVRELTQAGVAEGRLSVATFADSGCGRGFEIVVHASPAAARKDNGKERADVKHG